MNGTDRLAQLVQVLEQIEALLPDDQTTWDDDLRTRLAIERLVDHRRQPRGGPRVAAREDVGVEPWAELYRFRNLIAHALPDDLSSDRLWAETVADLPRLLDAVRTRRG